jgi:hypothetical protein
MTSKFAIALVTIFAFFSSAANAVQVIYADPLDSGTPENADGNTNGIVIAIKRLDIGGTLYNVDFDYDTYPTYLGDSDYWSSLGEAETARDSILSLLNSEAVGSDPVALGTIKAPLAGFFSVNYDSGASNVNGFRNKALDAGSMWASDGGFTTQTDKATAWSVVPIPGAVWLFGSGLGFLGWMRRRSTAVA